MRLFAVFMLFFMLLSVVVTAYAGQAPEIQVRGLFTDKAVVIVDGTRHVLAEGEESPEGLRIVSVDGERVIFDWRGERIEGDLDRTVGGTYSPPARNEVRLQRNAQGMFQGQGAINGRSMIFLVDTGASAVAIGMDHARQLGLDPVGEGVRVQVDTASGLATGYRIMLDSVRLGTIRVHNVPALVVDGDGPSMPLLGNTFLGRVNMEQRGNALILRATN